MLLEDRVVSFTAPRGQRRPDLHLPLAAITRFPIWKYPTLLDFQGMQVTYYRFKRLDRDCSCSPLHSLCFTASDTHHALLFDQFLLGQQRTLLKDKNNSLEAYSCLKSEFKSTVWFIDTSSIVQNSFGNATLRSIAWK